LPDTSLKMIPEAGKRHPIGSPAELRIDLTSISSMVLGTGRTGFVGFDNKRVDEILRLPVAKMPGIEALGGNLSALRRPEPP
jgi:hypothetical protein